MPQVLTGHRQITDAYLVALAIHNKGKLATLDRGIQQWAPKGSVELIGK
jgi:predicted nucleic acid-binding protein